MYFKRKASESEVIKMNNAGEEVYTDFFTKHSQKCNGTFSAKSTATLTCMVYSKKEREKYFKFPDCIRES